jgi:predicted transcriptional regulator
VRLLPVHAMPNLRRRYDRHSMRLFLSERLSPFDQLREVALEAGQLRVAARSSHSELDALKLFQRRRRGASGGSSSARYAAHALMMPYGGVSFGCAPRALRHRRACARGSASPSSRRRTG